MIFGHIIIGRNEIYLCGKITIALLGHEYILSSSLLLHTNAYDQSLQGCLSLFFCAAKSFGTPPKIVVVYCQLPPYYLQSLYLWISILPQSSGSLVLDPPLIFHPPFGVYGKLDDIYDVYGKLDELELFTDTVEWLVIMYFVLHASSSYVKYMLLYYLIWL